MLAALESTGLEYSLLHAEIKECKNFDNYFVALERNLYELAGYQTILIKPRFIASQASREHETGIPIYHETHRNKWAYAAYLVKRYLDDERFRSVKLALDFSH